MTIPTPQSGLQMRSLITPAGELELALHSVNVVPPKSTEVVVRVEAAPINPSDIGLLFGAADVDGTLAVSGSGTQAKATARVPERALRAMAARAGQALPCGNEGAGVVVEEGLNEDEARAIAEDLIESHSKYLFTTFVGEGSSFFSVKQRAGEILIRLNKDHPAYENLIEVLEEIPEDNTEPDELIERLRRARRGLKLLLMA